MLLFAFLILASQFRSAHSQLDANGISLAEKVLAIEQLMLTPGTIDFQVGPCDFVLNGPPNNSPDISGDQVCGSNPSNTGSLFDTSNRLLLNGSGQSSMTSSQQMWLLVQVCEPLCLCFIFVRWKTFFILIVLTDVSEGGLDASLLFEMDRPENRGVVFNNGNPNLNNFADRTVIGVSFLNTI